ncbi:MAG: B12-binding domain-containing radical SAM protein [Gemmatimonadetes bacterium]|nr:B12-binding domain-containing radical SAM protein [Gemmatimonadota bacterium]MDE3257162.1 B12-binding domain-containing radical SAM protein [Gemmatimonadota bacterium]
MPNALLVSPMNPVTFWSFDEALKVIDKKVAFPPLGLLTIAGMMSDSYDVRMVDMNAHPLIDEELEWADIVITSSMIIHWHSLEDVIARCNRIGVPVLNGGPLPTQYYEEIEGDAVFYLGEAENGFMDIVDRLTSGSATVEREYVDRRGKFQDLAVTPLPRWSLIDFDDYSNMVIQVTRGCPESCTFCNIPSLYGKITRLKSKSRMIQELDALYDSGWRGAVMAVDDNFVGNREDIRHALEDEVVPWQQERGYPFQFHTQASIRVSDDPQLLEAMYQAGFDKVFAGIESPVEESLKFMGAQKNLQGKTPLMDKVKILQETGFEVQAGFIIGLDTDPDDIAERTIAFIREAGIPVAMVGILGVLRDTPDYKRFSRQGRLVEGAKYTGDSGVFSRELSYVPLIDPDTLLERHRWTVETLNSPEIFFERCLTFFNHRGRHPIANSPIRMVEIKAVFRSIWRQGIRNRNYRWQYWKFMLQVLLKHPASLADAVRLAVQGHHLILTTQRALQVDEVKTFLDEALEHLEHFKNGYRAAYRKNTDTYAGRLMRAVHHRFEHFQDDHRTMQHHAKVLRGAAQEYYQATCEEFQHQIREPLERFQQDTDHLLRTFSSERAALQRS